VGALRTFRDERGGFFTLVLHPPQALDDVPRQPREMVFVVDCSGSMQGEPLAACKRAMRRCLRRLDANDTFQIVRFSNTASALGPKPVPATPANLERGRRFVDGLATEGGTMMIHGIRAALDAPRDSERYRIVSFMTDGFIGNEREILAEVHARVGDSRIFSFGVGNSVNRYLLERMAQAGRGAAAYVRIDEDGERAVDGLYRRLERPALTDVEVDWGGMGATDVFPEALPDLFVGRPLVVAGRFRGQGRTEVRVRGRMGGRPAEVAIPVDLDDPAATHEAIAKLWARARIASLDARMDRGGDERELAGAIRDTALEHGLVSAFTAFVAVDSTRRTEGDHGTTVPVPVPVPQGTPYETTVR
jgi:Ca-activated chloride channel family protein